MKIVIENAYLIDWGEDDYIQSYALDFDLMDDIVANVRIWNETLPKFSGGKKLRLTLETEEE